MIETMNHLPSGNSDCIEIVERLASYIHTSSRHDKFRNVILSEAGFSFDNDRTPKCSKCHLQFKDINIDYPNSFDICQYHFKNSPKCRMAQQCIEDFPLKRTTEAAKDGLLSLATRFTAVDDAIKCWGQTFQSFTSKTNKHISKNISVVTTAEVDLSEKEIKNDSGISLEDDKYYSINHNKPKTELTIPIFETIPEVVLNYGSNLSMKSKTSFTESMSVKSEVVRSDFSVRNFIDRLDSFESWPKNNPMKPEDLARVGLIYLGSGDKTKCEFCSGILHEWEEGDDPQTEHDKFFPLCRNNNKHKQEVDLKSSETTNHSKDTSSDLRSTKIHLRRIEKRKFYKHGLMTSEEISCEIKRLDKENSSLRESKLCRLCLDRTIDTVFLPCGHLVSCKECAPKINKCAVCRTIIRGTVLALIPDN